LATNSVGEVQDWLEFAQKMGIKAVPIIGTSERHKHLSRLNQAVMFDNRQQSFSHPGFQWMSQSCPLFAIAIPQVPQSTSQKRNKTPCFGQLEDTDDPDHKTYDCPLVAVCPQHIKASDLEEAQLIIGTLPGFIYKKVSRHNVQENITILEYLALTTDLFVVDEVDLAQPKLDELFYPIVTIDSFKLTQDTWARSESSQHANGFLEGAIVIPNQYRDSYLEESEDWRRLADRAFSALMYSLRNIAESLEKKQPTQEIEKLLKECTKEGRLFAAWSLFDSLAEQLSGRIKVRLGQKIRQPTAKKYERSYERYRQIFKPVKDNPTNPDLTGLDSKDSKIVTRLASIAGIISGESYRKIPHPKCMEFIQETKWDTKLEKLESDDETFVNNLATLLQLSIFAAQSLGALGKHISTRRQSNSDLQSNLPLIPPADFNRLLPASPVGAVTSAQYQNEEDLKIHRGISVGRSLLSHWQSIFNIDGLAPSHLLVTSATSYSGDEKQSYPFHVQLKPSLLIEPPPEKAKTVAYESEFFFCPVADNTGDPVWISGSHGDERLDNIGKMVSGLCRPSAHGLPLIEQFQDYLRDKVGSDRKNLLLITNSYAEAKTFYKCLKQPYKDKASFVVRDGDNVLWTPDVNVPRSKMTEFPSQGKEFLIAPIGAISRAVNLMHPETGEPYFGGMVILVRQHPRPDDNQLVISAVNKETIDSMGFQSVANIQRLAKDTRDTFLAVPQIFSRLPDVIQGVAMKQPLVWTLAVNLTQLIGRSTRGGRKTVVWFTDAAFMPQTSQGKRAKDTEKNSLLLAVRKLLGDAINQGGASGRLIQTLYGPVYYPLIRLRHFISNVNL